MKKLLISLILILSNTTITMGFVNQNFIKNNYKITKITNEENQIDEMMKINYKEKYMKVIKELINNLGKLPENIHVKLNELVKKISNFPHIYSINYMFYTEYVMSLNYTVSSITKKLNEKGNIAASEEIISLLQLYIDTITENIDIVIQKQYSFNFRESLIKRIKKFIDNLGKFPNNISIKLNQLIEKLYGITYATYVELVMSGPVIFFTVLNEFKTHGIIKAGEKLIEILENYTSSIKNLIEN